MLDILRKANESNNLTSLGKDALILMEKIWLVADGNTGQLTPLGISQIKSIAQRMWNIYPQVFSNGANITAVSTTVKRCIESMNIFCNQLQQNNINLVVNLDAHERHMQYLNHHTKEAVAFRYSQDGWKKEYNQFVEKKC